MRRLVGDRSVLQHLRPEKRLRQYKIIKALGAGGFSVVYLARDETLDKLFAIKEYFPPQFAHRRGDTVRANPGEADNFTWGKARFIDDAKYLARFDHPNIVKVIQIFEANNTAYTVLEYLDGRHLKSWLDEINGPPTQKELDKIVDSILNALETIHRNEILHRDVSPDNILLCNNGTPVLLDFGSAKEAIGQRTRTVSAVVKDGYSPPEQYSTTGSGQGPWTDIYAFAATLYHAVSGARPEAATDRVLTDNYVSATEAAKGSYRSGFLNAIDWGLRVRQKDRPQSVADWRAALFAPDAPSAPQKKADKSDQSELPRPVPNTVPPWRALWFALLLGVLAIPSALLSHFASVDPWGFLSFNMASSPAMPMWVPLLPGIYFALVLCTGIYLWDSKRLLQLAVVFASVLFAWVCAYESANKILPVFGGEKEAKAIIGAGITAGFIGSTLVALGVLICSKTFRRPISAIMTVAAGTVAGSLLYVGPYNTLVLYLVWQPLIAGIIAFRLAYPKVLRDSETKVQVISRQQALALCVGIAILGTIGLFFHQGSEEGYIYNMASIDDPDNPAEQIDKLKAYLGSCWVCMHAKETREKIASLERYSNAGKVEICRDALNSDSTSWTADLSSQLAVVEATKRGYAVGDCRQALGLDRYSNAPKFDLCRDALAPGGANWDSDPQYRAAVDEAGRRGYTLADCRQVLGISRRAPNPAPPISPPVKPLEVDVGRQIRERAGSFVNEWYGKVSATAGVTMAAAVETYADQVNYFGKQYTREQVLQDVEGEISRWPNRQYNVQPGTVEINCAAELLTCTIRGKLYFDDNNPGKNTRAWGSATFEFVLSFLSPTGAPKIIQENGTNIDYHKDVLLVVKPPEALCDELAANPSDRAKSPSVGGVSFTILGAQSADAISNCASAVSKYPKLLRYQYQWARALAATNDPGNRQRAFEINKRLVDLGYAAAFDNLGWLYLTLYSPDDSFPIAIDLFRKGVKLGDSDAMLSLAEMVTRGRAMPVNASETAIALVTRAAQLGNPAASDELAKLQRQPANE